MAYHVRDIKKGVIGEFSKIEEEFDELLEAREQNAKVLELCELADLLGAIDLYLKKHFSMKLDDVTLMMKMTQQAFLEGERK
jgi:hypothetical protein